MTEPMAQATGEDWLFVPGHGPVTDATGVRQVRGFFDYVHQVGGASWLGVPVEFLDDFCMQFMCFVRLKNVFLCFRN